MTLRLFDYYLLRPLRLLINVMPRQPGDTAPTSDTQQSAQATFAEASARLTVGSAVRGEIVSQESNGSYTVACAAPRMQISGVEMAAPVFGGLMGFNVRCLLPKGTQVILAHGNPSFIYAIVPEKEKDWRNAGNRTLVWGPKVNDKSATTSTPEDMVEGEAEIGNLFGVSLAFLTTLIQMKAGDRAKIECHLINDMVRIVSSQFRHFSGIGEELIFDHGRPTLERGWSSYRHELMNQLKEGTPVAPLSGDGISESEVSADRVASVGRHRLLEYIGFAGDFIHSFVTDPPTTMVKMLKEQEESGKRSGKSWVHRGSDGAYVVQSVAEIRFERVVRIPTPVRIAAHEDADVTKSRQYDRLQESYLKLFDYGKAEDKSAYRQAYQLRSYSRWLTRFHAFARMLQLPDEYKIWSEVITPAPSWTNAEADKERANPNSDYYDAYACICILRDGSIITHDQYGASVVMSNGNIQLSAPRHIEIETGGDLRLLVGGSLYAKVKRNIEFTAVDGGIIFSSYAWFKGICEKGSLWLRSMAETSEVGENPPELEGRNGGPKPEVLEHAVMLEATAGGAAIRADKQVQVKIDGRGNPSGGDELGDLNYAFVVDAAAVRVRSKGSVAVSSSKSLVVSASTSIAVNSPALYGSLAEIDMGKNMQFANGQLSVSNFRCNLMQGNSIQGLKVGPFPDPASNPAQPTGRPHLNHIQLLQDRVVLTQGTNEEAIKALKFAKGEKLRETPSTWTRSSEGALWSFPAPSEYSWDSREETKGCFVESLTQQYLRLDGTTDAWGGAGFVTWDWASDKGPTGLRMGDFKTGFGSGATLYRSDGGENLHKPSASAPTTFGATSPGWNLEPFTMRILKRDE